MKKIIMDCDPGQDDALAIMMALGAPDQIDLLAITVVAGNVPLALTEKNALRLVELCKAKTPVYRGCVRPMIRMLATAEEVHGESGLDGSGLPEPTRKVHEGHAVDAIIDILASHEPKTVTLCPTGPLTNIALAMVKAPEIMERAAGIVLMGGSIELGNITPAAEFNIYVDPHAARIVFDFGLPITMFGLDVTHKVLTFDHRLEAIKAIGTDAAKAAYGMLEFYNRYDRQRYDEAGGPLHDPCVIAYLLKPELFDGRDCPVEIEINSELTIGRTLVDWWNKDKRPTTAKVMREVDADGFFELLNSCLKRL